LHNYRALACEVLSRCQILARYSEDAHCIRRTFLSSAIRDCHHEIARWVAPLGLESTVDAAGNLRILYPGVSPNSPRLLIGSHLDTVPDAGAYDGILGVVIAIALITAVNGKEFPFAIEAIGFSEEEGIRFGTPFIGSRAIAGTLDDELLNREDAQGISVRQAITNFGLDSSEIARAAADEKTLGYLEFHIEQGPVLEKAGHPLGVVEAIVGQSRLSFTFRGQANHAGTTPMSCRNDALVAAALWISAVENRAHIIPDLVATVGSVRVKPGAANVIPGETELSLDVRHQNDNARKAAVDYMIREAEDIAQTRGLRLETVALLDQQAVPMNAFLVEQIVESIRKIGCEPYRMVSGAGHDAMILASKIPSAMIFLRTPGGISHDPAESVEAEDVAKSIECGVQLLNHLAVTPDFLSIASTSRRHSA
jgi:allantoate deiminase